MQQHIKLLAIFNLVYGGLMVVAAVVMMAVFGGLAGLSHLNGPDSDSLAGAGLFGILGAGLTLMFLVLAAPSIIAGIGLLSYKPWARVLTIVVSALHLLSIPIGTALGIYGLWVMLKPESEALFRSSALPRPI